MRTRFFILPLVCLALAAPSLCESKPGDAAPDRFVLAKVRLLPKPGTAGLLAGARIVGWNWGSANGPAVLARVDQAPAGDGWVEVAVRSGKVFRFVQFEPAPDTAVALAEIEFLGPAGKTPKDAVHVYLGRHNREVVYNADDLHVAIPRKGRPGFVRSHTPWWFMETAVAETEDGYCVEVRIGPAYFQGKGIATVFGRNVVYGFDIAVDEGDKEIARQVWRGTERNDEDTRGFGSLVLTDVPVR